MENILKEHADMVAALGKPGEDILKTLTPEKVHIWHMATGVSGEAGELLLTMLSAYQLNERFDKENVKEELGDTEFYLRGLCDALDIDVVLDITDCTPPHPALKGALPVASAMSVSAANLLDQVKKCVVYNKELDAQAVELYISEVFGCMQNLYGLYKLDRGAILEGNREKLQTGSKARYGAEYTDEAAQVRRDKQDEEVVTEEASDNQAEDTDGSAEK